MALSRRAASRLSRAVLRHGSLAGFVQRDGAGDARPLSQGGPLGGLVGAAERDVPAARQGVPPHRAALSRACCSP
eukprot:2045939-Prymnesium_polylepis.1